MNIYRIDEEKHRDFERKLEENLSQIGTVSVLDKNAMEFVLYKKTNGEKKGITWNWILEEFSVDTIQVETQPRAIVKILFNEEIYAITFGHSYFLVDKFCDRDFAFSFARKSKYKEIKTTALTSPNSQRNKTINTYIDYNQLEFDSGESFTKLKAKLKQNREVKKICSELVEIGNSLKFDLKENSLKNIHELITYIVNVLKQKDICKIPVFSKVKEEALLKKLNKELKKSVENKKAISISEIDIIGVTEIFNNNDSSFRLWHGQKRKEVSELSYAQLEAFANEKELNLTEDLLDIKVQSLFNGASVRTDRIRNLIDYVNDDLRCILTKGEWYYFNDDYLDYLKDSIGEIDSIYCQEFDFNDTIHNDFIQERYLDEKDLDIYKELSETEIKAKLKRKYYAERTFNLLREHKNNFILHDRQTESVNGAVIELMDLYKDETMFAVKIGNSSSSLCYAVDQSLTSLKMYKHNKFKEMPEVKRIGVWLILERKTKLPNIDGKPDINKLDMLMLKNKLDIWKKEVRVLGYEPVVYINYRKN